MLNPLRVSMLASAVALTALTIVAASLASPDGLIERSYTQAFDRSGTAAASGTRTVASAFDPAHLHLSRLPAGGTASGPVGTSLGIGDRITLAQLSGGTATYEVVDVRPLPLAALGGGDAAGKVRLVLVTAVASSQLPVQTIRFIVDADAPAGMPGSFKPRAL